MDGRLGATAGCGLLTGPWVRPAPAVTALRGLYLLLTQVLGENQPVDP